MRILFTPLKFNIDTLEKVTPFKYGHFLYLFVKFLGCTVHTPQKLQLAPEDGLLEDDSFLLGFGLFSGAFAVLGKVFFYYFYMGGALFIYSRYPRDLAESFFWNLFTGIFFPRV